MQTASVDTENFVIRTQRDLEEAVELFGILPLFQNPIPGFSVEEHADPACWFTGEEGVWEWKGPVIQNTGCAYGKFLGNKAVFISRKWFPDFANWRRDGYDFDARYDDELAAFRDKVLFDLIDAHAPILSGDLKKLGNYGKNGNKGFDGIIGRLQAQCYVLISDFVYKKDRFGSTYGWGTAQYSTPEKFMGKSFTDNVYAREPEESYRRILSHIETLSPSSDRKTIGRYLRSFSGAVRAEESRMWLVPSNPKYFDIVAAFSVEEIIDWKQGNDNIREGDIVYMYVGAPYSAILYRCEVVETDIPFHGTDEHVNIKNLMRIKRLETYPSERMPLAAMKELGVGTVRCTRGMPPALAQKL